MAYQYQVTAERVADRTFKCRACGARGVVAFAAVGRGAWAKETIFAATSAEQRAAESAQQDLLVDEDRVLGLITCPTCARRAPGATTWMVVRPMCWVVTSVLSLVWLGTDPGVWPAAFLGGVAVWQASREHGRFTRAGKATFSQLTPGTPPPMPTVGKSPPRPKPRLPIARALAAPPIARVAAPVIAIAPPVSPSPRTAADEPTFLAARDELPPPR